jgi:hypothetical protein
MQVLFDESHPLTALSRYSFEANGDPQRPSICMSSTPALSTISRALLCEVESALSLTVNEVFLDCVKTRQVLIRCAVRKKK